MSCSGDESDDAVVENDIQRLRNFGHILNKRCSVVLRREVFDFGNPEPKNGLQEEGGRDLLSSISRDIAGASSTKNNTLVINRIILHYLRKLETQIAASLEANEEEQKSVNCQLKKARENFFLHQNVVYASIIKCGMPYFTFSRNWTQPDNQFKTDIKNHGGALPEDHFKPALCWSPNETAKLCAIMAKLDQSNLSDVDWNEVSLQFFSNYTPDECEAQWTLSLRPGINKCRWQPESEEKLNDIAFKENYQGWDKIAEKVGTGHSGLQCCLRFQRSSVKFNDKWTFEDDRKLQTLAPLFFKTSRPIPKLQYFFDDKLTSSVIKRCKELEVIRVQSINVNKKLVHKLFKIVPEKSQKSLGLTVSKYLPLSTWRTLKRRLHRILEQHISFSSEEDKLLLQAVRDLGKDWPVVAEAVPERQPYECAARYRALVHATDDILKHIPHQGQTALGLLPVSRGGDVWPILQLFWEKKSDVNVKCERYGVAFDKSMSLPGQQLLRLLEMGRSNLFGPRFRQPHTPSQRTELSCQMMTVAKALSTVFQPSVVAHRLLALDDLGMAENTLVTLTEEANFYYESEKSRLCLVPPNYATLMGARVLTWGKGLLTGQADLPIEFERTKMDENIPEAGRLTFDESKKRLAERMMSLFFMSLCMGELQGNPVAPPTVMRGLPVKKNYRSETKLRKKRMALKLNENKRRKKIEAENIDEPPPPPPPKRAKMIRVTAVKARGRKRKETTDSTK